MLTELEKRFTEENGYFAVSHLHREDLYALGFDTSKITDDQMRHLAGELANEQSTNLFNEQLDYYASDLDIPKRKMLPTGCIFDCSRGIYITPMVIKLAIEHGFDTEVKGFNDLTESQIMELDFVDELFSDAEEFLQKHVVPHGYWCGSSEGGDWGVWED